MSAPKKHLLIVAPFNVAESYAKRARLAPSEWTAVYEPSQCEGRANATTRAVVILGYENRNLEAICATLNRRDIATPRVRQ